MPNALPPDIAGRVAAIADRCGKSEAEVIAHLIRVGLDTEPNPAPWNIDERAPAPPAAAKTDRAAPWSGR